MKINKITWLTDIHLNFIDFDARKKFYHKVHQADSEAILITGDIAEAIDVCEILNEFSLYTSKPIYFVLGNHDYYHGKVVTVREKILRLCSQNDKLIWLGKPALININKHTLLVGFDGWADARYGDYDHSSASLNDSRLINELFQAAILNKAALQKQMQKLADADASLLKQTITTAMHADIKKVIIATHVPPFAECSWHDNKPCDEYWLPYFSSKASGDIIAEVALHYPETNFLVLCGHAHSHALFKPYHNLEIKTGEAHYYQPELQEIISVS